MQKQNSEQMTKAMKKMAPDSLKLYLDLLECANHFMDRCKHLEAEVARLERLSHG
jgi:hypothetical protein